MFAARRLLLTAIALALVAVTVIAPGATARSQVLKPVIGKAVTIPARPLAGRPFTVSFKVIRSDTRTPLLKGRMMCDPSIAGAVIRHAESFKAGTARLAFVVPATAQGKLLKVKLTIKATGGSSATRVETFLVQKGATVTPSLTISDASVTEGNSGTTPLSFPVRLSAASTQTVTVAYATSDGSAAAPSDYAAANGTLTFKPGETSKQISVSVVGDQAVEPNETLTVTLSNPVNATVAKGAATGTITNDDTGVPVTAGPYKGATTEGNYVFFTVTSGRTITDFRINALPLKCTPGGSLSGAPDFSGSVFTIKADGSFAAKGNWDGSDKQGDIEWTHWDATITGQFTTATTVTGTILVNYGLTYDGTRFQCTSSVMTWSATLQS